ALPDLTQAIESHTLPRAERTMALFDRGIALDALGRLSEALNDYDACVKLSPGSAPALNNRANAYRRLGRLEDARRDYLASLAAGNSQPEYSNYGLGEIAEAQGDTNTARDFYAKALATDPGYRLAADRLAALGDARKGSAAAIALHPPGRPLQADVASAKPLPAVPPLPDNSVPLSAAQLVLRLRVASASRGDSAVPLRPAIVSGKAPAHGHQVQLGSWRQEAQANAAWSRAVKKAGGDLAGLSPQIVPADLPARGRYYRLRVSPEAAAVKFCADLTAKGLDCLPVSD
ncbi:MAG TPA: tetratricopeptide repeat protein, partial [Rhizomicrobium sp.]|nr:tetratricopeptide repeat protein [Rhizomicrobium sp.]